MNYIELLTYGDFDIQYTDSIWVGPGNALAARAEVNAIVNSYDNGKDKMSAAIEVLKQHGFSKIKTTKVVVSND